MIWRDTAYENESGGNVECRCDRRTRLRCRFGLDFGWIAKGARSVDLWCGECRYCRYQEDACSRSTPPIYPGTLEQRKGCPPHHHKIVKPPPVSCAPVRPTPLHVGAYSNSNYRHTAPVDPPCQIQKLFAIGNSAIRENTNRRSQLESYRR
jgi:hypothetical protein